MSRRVSAAVSARATSLRAMTALAPLLLLDVLAGSWIHFHLPWLRQWLSTNIVLLGGFAIVWAMLPADTVTEMKAAVARTLQSRRLTRALWGATSIFVVFTLFVSTVEVTSGGNIEPVTVYRLSDAAEPAGGTPPPVDSARLDKAHGSRTFVVLTTPLGRTLRFRTSPTSEAPPVRVRSWIPAMLIAPDDFAAPVTVAALLTGLFAVDMMGAQTVRMQARAGDLPGELVADDTVRVLHALLLSATPPAPPDSVTRQRWLLAASRLFQVDTAEVEPLVRDWMTTRWIRTARPLRSGERLQLTFVNARGDTLARHTFNLTQRFTDVIIRRT